MRVRSCMPGHPRVPLGGGGSQLLPAGVTRSGGALSLWLSVVWNVHQHEDWCCFSIRSQKNACGHSWAYHTLACGWGALPVCWCALFACWIDWFDSYLILTLPGWISLVSVKLFTPACPGISKENQTVSLETELHLVHPSCWVDPQGKMPTNIIRGWPQV